MKYSKKQLLAIGLDVLSSNDKKLDENRLNRLYRSCFGVSLIVVYQIWKILEIQNRLPHKGHPTHLYWMLCFLKSYNTKNFYSALFHVHENTFRKWVWKFIHAVSDIEIVSMSPNVCIFVINFNFN